MFVRLGRGGSFSEITKNTVTWNGGWILDVDGAQVSGNLFFHCLRGTLQKMVCVIVQPHCTN